MSLTTFSIFYYNFEADDDHRYLAFDEGSGELQASLELGSFTPTDMATNIQTAMNEVGSNSYVVTFNRDDRSFTIESTTGNFDLLVLTGTSGSSIFSVIGFTGADRTGDDEYTGGESGDFYEPQFILQDHIPTDNYQKLVSPAVNKSAEGMVEVIRFGTEKFLQLNIKYATNKVSDGRIIKYNPEGVEDLVRFMQFIMQKKEIEYMPNINSRSTFQKVLLEQTQDEPKGTGFKLRELYDKGLPNYFETGPLVFRLIEG